MIFLVPYYIEQHAPSSATLHTRRMCFGVWMSRSATGGGRACRGRARAVELGCALVVVLSKPRISVGLSVLCSVMRSSSLSPLMNAEPRVRLGSAERGRWRPRRRADGGGWFIVHAFFEGGSSSSLERARSYASPRYLVFPIVAAANTSKIGPEQYKPKARYFMCTRASRECTIRL